MLRRHIDSASIGEDIIQIFIAAYSGKPTCHVNAGGFDGCCANVKCMVTADAELEACRTDTRDGGAQ